MRDATSRLRRLQLAAGLAAGLLLPASARLEAALMVTPLTWNAIGLDSNNPAAGPKNFPVGFRVCSTVATTNVSVTFSWDTANTYVNLRPGSASGFNIAFLSAGGCSDAYFEVEVTRTAAAFDTKRRYHVTATDGSATGVSPTPRELYVERLISQNRNGVNGVTVDGVFVPPGGTMNFLVGNTYTIALSGYTATQGYNQFESFINFPNLIFQILSVSTSYSADSASGTPPCPYPCVPNPNSGLYADACGWDNDPGSPNYRSCVGGDYKAGGSSVVTTYVVKILSGAGTNQTLNTLLYDFSGSSYHYNADYPLNSWIAAISSPADSLTFAKSFSPSPIAAGGVSTVTFTITNPTASAVGGVGFTDTLPTSPGAMVVANPASATTSPGCGSPTFAPNPGDASLSFSNGTIAAGGTCTVSVKVTAPAAGIYANTATLTAGAATKTAGASLTAGNVTPPPCVPGTQLAQWQFGTTTLPPPYTSKSAQVSSATASFSGLSNVIDTTTGSPAANSWSGVGEWPQTNTGFPNPASPYFEFTLDTSQFTGVAISFSYDLEATGDWANPGNNFVYVYSSANGGAFSSLSTISASKGNWYASGTIAAAATGSSMTTFRINATGRNKTGARVLLDNVVFTGCAANLSPPSPPTISKTFGTNPVAVGGTSTLTFTLTNPNGGTALSGVAFSDVLPAGLTVGSSGPTTTCGGSLTTTAPDTISFAGGSLAAGGSCNVVVSSVTASTAGPHVNVSGYVSSTESGTNTGAGGFATATLTALAPPLIVKSFAPTSIVAGIGTSAATFQITNPNASVALTGVAFNDSFPSSPGQMVVATPATFSTTGCGSPTFSPVAGATSISFSGATIAAGGTCTVTVNVSVPAAGAYANTTFAVFSTNGGTGLPSNTANLTAASPTPSLDLRKEVSTSSSGPWTMFVVQTPGQPVYYRFTLYNSGDVTLTNLSVSDPTLAGTAVDPAACGWPASLAPGATATCVAGSPSSVAALSGSNPNTATASGSYLGTPYPSAPDSASYLGAAPGFSLLKQIATSASGPWSSAITGVAPGGSLYYRFTVVNTGAVDLTGVNVTDALVSTASCTFTDPLPVGSVTVCVVGPVAASSTPGTTTNTATAHGTTPSSIVIDTNPSSASYTVPGPDLTIAKTHSGSFSQGQAGATYSVTVTNGGTGPKTAGNTVTVNETAPAGLTVTAMNGIGWLCIQPAGPCTRSDALAAGASYDPITVTVDVSWSATSPQVNSVDVALTGQAESDTTNNSASDSTVILGVTPTPTPTPTNTPTNTPTSTPTNTPTLTPPPPTPTFTPTNTPTLTPTWT
ncbi:MAG TPA: hypothetical protein PK598_04545, partial [Thermoanaerobaculia bacterium]|nr:hypothetical protein [Thermoanaerobaculia bacterium]